jgi:hypothetical protein
MLLRWGLAGVLVLHGIGHAMFAFTAWTDTPMGFTDSPWLLPGGMTATSLAGQISAALWLIALIFFLLAAVGIVRSAGWWPRLALAAAVMSLVVLVLWWNTITPDSRLWALLVDLAILIALAGPWRSTVIAAIG